MTCVCEIHVPLHMIIEDVHNSPKGQWVKDYFIRNGYLIFFLTWAPLYQHGLTLIPAWISNYIHCKVLDEIAYPFLNFNGATVEV